MRHYALAVLFILAILSGNCQQLNINDKVPDITLGKILNWKADTLRLLALGKKLIILDFWSFNCLACLQAFPEIDSLQKKFDNDIQFIGVNNESTAMTKKFIENHPQIHFPAIPFVTGDTALSKFFPRAFSPWHVWIDSSLEVRFITDGYNATSSHIRNFLNRTNTFDGGFEPDFTVIYPLLVVQDYMYEVVGLNKLLNVFLTMKFPNCGPEALM